MTGDDAGLVVVVGSHGASLVVTAGSSPARQEMGPVAWSALEMLALSAQPDAAGALLVVLGVRELAGRLGVGRDAAANALTKLRGLGLISAVQQRAGRGRFDGTRHTILLPVIAERSPSSRRSRGPGPARETTPPTSLSLFDDSTSAPRPNVTNARDERRSDHSTQGPGDVPKKVHELAFDRMRRTREQRGTSPC